MRLLQLLAAFIGGSVVIWLGAENPMIIAVNAFFAAYFVTWLIARLRSWGEQPNSGGKISIE